MEFFLNRSLCDDITHPRKCGPPSCRICGGGWETVGSGGKLWEVCPTTAGVCTLSPISCGGPSASLIILQLLSVCICGGGSKIGRKQLDWFHGCAIRLAELGNETGAGATLLEGMSARV